MEWVEGWKYQQTKHMILMQEIEFTQIDGKHGWNGWKGGDTHKLIIIMYQIYTDWP